MSSTPLEHRRQGPRAPRAASVAVTWSGVVGSLDTTADRG